MNATNTFQNGLVTDSHPLAVSNDALTNCLNGTLITYNGNELILQNDVGNSKIIYKDDNNVEQEVQLSKGFIPIGMKSFGNIIYIFSHNPTTLEGEIGTFPSPDYENYQTIDDTTQSYGIHKLQYVYKPLHNLVKETKDSNGQITRSLNDLRTTKFNFDLEHHIEIDFQPSYDESINIIFNDGKNIPRLVNNGFSPYGNNEVKIVKRIQNLLETNVYEEENFEYNTSLVRVCNSIVKIEFIEELDQGNLPIGNYTFYFKVADSDNNESDFIGQSGLVVCHKGKLNSIRSIDGGVAGEDSNKTVRFKLSKIPRQFTRLYVYYSRNTCTQNGTLTNEYKKIDKYFDLSEVDPETGLREATINITGNDTTTDIGLVELNQLSLNPRSAKTQAISDNILFLGNTKENKSLYNRLRLFSENYVTVEPAESETIDDLLFDVGTDYKNYHSDIAEDKLYGYYNIHNIYNRVGYWPEEYYRFGIVYILSDYKTTPVFNIKGIFDNKTNKYGIIQFKKHYFKQHNIPGIRQDNNTIHVLQFPKFHINGDLPEDVIGCIFVRQKRIKNIIGQALQIGTDSKFTNIPVLWAGNERKWVAQSFVRNSTDISLKPLPFSDSPSDIVTSMNNNTNTGGRASSGVPFSNSHDEIPGLNYHGTSKELNYFRHDYRPDGMIIPENSYEDEQTHEIVIIWQQFFAHYMSFFDGPEDIKLGNSWITNLPPLTGKSLGSILRIFDKNTRSKINEVPEEYKIQKDAAIMPEFELKQDYYSSIFSGGKFTVDQVIRFDKLYCPSLVSGRADSQKINLSYISPINPTTIQNNEVTEANIIAVREQTVVKTADKVFKSVAGNPHEVTQYVIPFTDRIIVNQEVPNVESGTDKDWYEGYGVDKEERKGLGRTIYMFGTRGIFSPYLGFVTNKSEDFTSYTLTNIKVEDVNADNLEIRKQDYSEFYPISDRIDFSETNSRTFKCFRGDCYIGNFTHRMLRNFIDPEFPIQDEFAEIYSWSLGNRLGGYDKSDPKNKGDGWDVNDWDDDKEGDENHIWVLAKDTYTMSSKAKQHLNRADVNAVPLGQWITFKYYSSINPCMRSSDGSNISERTTFGQPRTFYPLYNINLDNNVNKLSDSYVYNEGYEQSLGSQIYELLPEVPALKENFSNRVIYSDISIDSLTANNLRTFKTGSNVDYTRQYGEITKLIPYSSQFLCIVFEHGVGLVQVNEKAIAASLQSKTVYIDTDKVLGDLNTQPYGSEEFGSQWPESVISTPTGIYGVDTDAKKIWRLGTQFECISDLKVNKFLRDNLITNQISNQENVLIFNVKTHYNSFKQDILFTFYRYLEDGTLIAWNLCYNEVTKKMTTFYSWVPLASANINNTFYSIEFNTDIAYKYLRGKSIEDTVLNLWQHNKHSNWCNWYGKQHPFEFEYVVNANPNFQKIYNNLEIISNKTAPESFHFEIVGESYDFSKDKKNMYHRQEATKAFYDWCMSRVLNDKSVKLQYDTDAVENTYLTKNLQQNQKSIIFPLTVKRLDHNNVIYDIYKQLTSNSYDYEDLSGSEIVYDPTTNDYLINTHIKAHPKGDFIWQTVCRVDDEDVNTIANYYVRRGIEIRIDGEYLQKKVKYDPRLCNCKYVEDSWKIQIPSINYFEKNEDWNKTDGKPPINIVMDPLPDELINQQELPLNSNYPIDTEQWVSHKQTKLRDKYIKIKIRYSGDDLAIISGIINTFKETYN